MDRREGSDYERYGLATTSANTTIRGDANELVEGGFNDGVIQLADFTPYVTLYWTSNLAKTIRSSRMSEKDRPHLREIDG